MASPDFCGRPVNIEIAADELPTPLTQQLVLKVSEDPTAPLPQLHSD